MSEEVYSTLRIELFGGPRVRFADGRIVTFQPKPAALLTLLALEPGTRHSRDSLAESLWPDEPPEVTRGRLRVALATLKRAIPDGDDLIHADTQAIWLNSQGSLFIDASEFDRLLSRARSVEDDDSRVDCLSRLVDLYTGPLAPRVYVDEVVRERHRYEMKIAEARRSLAQLVADREAATRIAIANGEEAHVPSTHPNANSRDHPEETATAPTRPARRASHGIRRAALTGIGLAVLLGAWLWVHRSRSVESLSIEDRIRILERLRNAGSQAESRAELEKRHRLQAEQCLALGEEAWKAAYGRDEQTWLSRLQPLEPDIESTLRWMLDHEPEKALQLIGALGRYWWIREKRNETRRWLEPALERSPKVDSLVRARALSSHAMCVLESTDIDTRRARAHYLQALTEINQAHDMYARLGHRWGQAHTRRCRGHIFHALGQDTEAERSFNEAFSLFIEDGNLSGEAYTLWGLSLLNRPGETQAASYLRRIRLGLQSVQLYRKAGNAWGLAVAFHNLELYVDDIEAYKDLCPRPESLILLRGYLDECQAYLDRPEVRDSPSETLDVRKRIARTAILLNDRATAVEQLGHLNGPHGDVRGERMARLAGAYLRYIDETSNPPYSGSYMKEFVRAAIGPHPTSKLDIASLITQGRRMSLEAAIQEATR